MPFPEDLLIAYQTFTALASEYGYVYAALMVNAGENPEMLVIGNASETACNAEAEGGTLPLARLLRMHADLLEEKVRKGLVADPRFSDNNSNYN